MNPLFLALSDSTTEAPPWLVYAIVGGFLIVFPLFWCAIVFLISGISGWQSLAKVYAAGDRPLTGKAHTGVRGMIGIASYKFTLTVHVTDTGFFLGVMPLFRPGHPRLFIPWSAISERKTRSFLMWESEVLSIGSPKITTIAIPSNILKPPA